MSRNTIKFFTIININTNAETIVRATSESEALEVWARGLGRASFGAACELIGVCPEDIEVVEGEEVAEVLAARVNEAKSLGAMWAAFQSIRAEHGDVQREASGLIRWDALPTWSTVPADTNCVWSYDRTRAIVGEGLSGLTLVTREDVGEVGPDDVKIHADNGDDLPDTIERLINFDANGERKADYPHDLMKTEMGRARLANLMAALGATLGDLDNGFDGISEEDTLVMDPTDGLLVLYIHPNQYAWESEL